MKCDHLIGRLSELKTNCHKGWGGGAGIDAMTFRVRGLRDVLLNVSVAVNCQRDTTQ
jgi:hypothetical protein